MKTTWKLQICFSLALYFHLSFVFVFLFVFCITGCPKKVTNRMLLEPWCSGSTTGGWHPVGLESVVLCRFLLRLSRIKRSQVMSMVKFSPIRHGICQIFYTSKFPKCFNFIREKRVNHNIFNQKLKTKNDLLIFF